jgi:hypothetical protein
MSLPVLQLAVLAALAAGVAATSCPVGASQLQGLLDGDLPGRLPVLKDTRPGPAIPGTCRRLTLPDVTCFCLTLPCPLTLPTLTISAEPSGLGILVPFYVDPDGPAYDRLASFGGSCVVSAIVNGDSNGPPDANQVIPYANMFSRLLRSGIRLYGYVHSMADVSVSPPVPRPLSDVLRDVEDWFVYTRMLQLQCMKLRQRSAAAYYSYIIPGGTDRGRVAKLFPRVWLHLPGTHASPETT